MPRYSQHFLTSGGAAAKIAAACKRNPCDFSLEIGPGKGFLTKFLLEAGLKNFRAAEIDPVMVSHLKSEFPALNIIAGDFLELDIESLFPPGADVLFAGNLPYAVAAPILQKILGFSGFRAAVLMFQKEVAERILAKSGGGYGVLSLSVMCRAETKLVAVVKRGSFNPPPKVESAVVEFKRLKTPVFAGPEAERAFFRTVKAAFSSRRKTVLNSLADGLGVAKPQAAALLEAAGIDPTLRPERVSFEQYIKLSQAAR